MASIALVRLPLMEATAGVHQSSDAPHPLAFIALLRLPLVEVGQSEFINFITFYFYVDPGWTYEQICSLLISGPCSNLSASFSEGGLCRLIVMS